MNSRADGMQMALQRARERGQALGEHSAAEERRRVAAQESSQAMARGCKAIGEQFSQLVASLQQRMRRYVGAPNIRC